jgi:hypothetical protein
VPDMPGPIDRLTRRGWPCGLGLYVDPMPEQELFKRAREAVMLERTIGSHVDRWDAVVQRHAAATWPPEAPCVAP